MEAIPKSFSLATVARQHFCNCRIHHVTASMTTIDLIIKPRTELLEPVTTLFKLAAPSISSCALSIYFSQFLPLLLFSSYPLPTLTMDHIPLSKCGGLWTFVFSLSTVYTSLTVTTMSLYLLQLPSEVLRLADFKSLQLAIYQPADIHNELK